jgi:hypothetical protein
MRSRESGEEDNQTALFYRADLRETTGQGDALTAPPLSAAEIATWDETFGEDTDVPFGSYTELEKEKVPSFRERFLKKHRVEGKER